MRERKEKEEEKDTKRRGKCRGGEGRETHASRRKARGLIKRSLLSETRVGGGQKAGGGLC